ncbi:hypothetical protein BSNK01_26660 [Bacillaceae bacterium]
MNRIRTTIHFGYLLFLVAITIGVPVLLYLGTAGTLGALTGAIGAVLAFFLLASYVVYTLLLGRRDS